MLKTLGFATVGLAVSLMFGCSARVTARSYDPYYHDYHVWNDAEGPFYNRWIIETHHPNVVYGRLGRRDREAYWRWRHDHH